MKKLLAMAVLAAGLVLGSAANAAQVDIFVVQQGSGSSNWSLIVDNNSADVGIGGVSLLVRGLSSIQLNAANANISPLGPTGNSVFSIDPVGDGQNFVGIYNVTGGVGFVTPLAQDVLLGTLTGPGPVSVQGTETDFGSATILDANGADLPASVYSITVVPVPEPAMLLMLGMGLAGLALVRRSA